MQAFNCLLALTFGIELVHLPPVTAKARQTLALVAHGTCCELSFYKDHEFNTSLVGTQDEILQSYCDHGKNSAPNAAMMEEEVQQLHGNNDSVPDDNRLLRIQTARNLIDAISIHLHSVVNNDVSESLVKLLTSARDRYIKCQTESALESLLAGSTAVLQKSARSKSIHVQPTSIARRTTGKGSSKPQTRGAKTSLSLKIPKKRKKKPHKLSQSVEGNILNATKH